MASFTTQSIGGSATDPDYLYYNATIINNNQSTTQPVADPTLYFQDTRSTPLVADASKYVLSVENFTLNGATKQLPIFIPTIQPTSDPNLTDYSVTFQLIVSIAGTLYIAQDTEFVRWVPENVGSGLDLPAPPTSGLPTQVDSDYYYCYTYTHWVNLVNTALQLAYQKCVTAFNTGIIGVGPYTQTGTYTPGLAYAVSTKCPFFEFNSTTGLFSLCEDSNSCINDGQPFSTGPFNGLSPTYYNGGLKNWESSYVGMNINLEGLLTNFDTTYYGPITPLSQIQGFYGTAPNKFTFTTASDGTIVYLPENIINVDIDEQNARSESNATAVATDGLFALVNPFSLALTTNVYARVIQDYISTGTLWSPVASIVLVTTQLPVRNEPSASPVTFGTANTGTTSSASGAFNRVLIETPIDALTADIWRGFIKYEPKTPTFTSFGNNKEPIQNVDVKVYWRNRLTNALEPLDVYNGGTMNLRLLFKKKTAS